MKIQNLPSQQLRTLRTPGEQPQQPPVSGDSFQPGPVRKKSESMFLPKLVGTVAAVGAAALGYYAGASGSLLAGVASGAMIGTAVLGAVGLMADIATMISGDGSNTAKGALLGAVLGGIVGASVGSFAHPAAGVALGAAAALPAGFVAALITKAKFK
jgi:hypothetical protein